MFKLKKLMFVIAIPLIIIFLISGCNITSDNDTSNLVIPTSDNTSNETDQLERVQFPVDHGSVTLSITTLQWGGIDPSNDLPVWQECRTAF